MPCREISDCAQISKTIIAVRHFGLGGRESLETAVIEKCEKLVEGIEKIKKQQNKNIWKTRVDNLSSNWESCRQNIFETVLSCAAANIEICSSCLKNESVIYCGDCVQQKKLCSLCDEKVHKKYPLHDRDGICNGY